MRDQPGVLVKQRRTRAEIKQIVAEFATSGVTRTEFCRREQIGRSTLVRHLKRQAKETSSVNAGLIAVEVTGTRSERSRECALAVVLRRGHRIEVGAGFDAPTLQRLVLVLERM